MMDRLESSLPAVLRRHANAWIFIAVSLLFACSPEQQSIIKSKVSKVNLLSQKKQEGPDDGWTPEKISIDPSGYLQYVSVKVATQIQGRKDKLAQLSIQKDDVDSRANSLNQKVADAQNIIKRMRTAMQRADDETNWPFKMAGKSFDQTHADNVINGLERFIADREPLVQAYGDAVNRIASTENILRTDIENLTRMLEKVGLDLERVRLNQNLSELGDMHKTETELAAFVKSLADISDDTTLGKLRVSTKTSEALNAESFLR